MLSRRKIIGIAVALGFLGVAGYACLNPAFAATCKSAYDTSAAWVRHQADTAGQAFKRTEFYASVTREMRVIDSRIAARKKAAAAAKSAEQRAAATAKASRADRSLVSVIHARQDDVSSVTVRPPEQAGWSAGRRIANGHAFAKHGKEFGFTSESQMAEHVDQVIFSASAANIKQLRHGQTAYWDEATRSVVIVDPGTRDGGTTFKPRRGRSYFESLR
jgi:hypothetical protein